MILSLAEFKRRIDAISGAIRSLGGEVQELVICPPATEQEIERVEHQLGLSLPGSFKQALLHIAGEFSFCWFMPDDYKFPEPYRNIFSGRIHWNLQQLPQIDEGKRECIEQVFPNPEDEYDKVWHDKLAFQVDRIESDPFSKPARCRPSTQPCSSSRRNRLRRRRQPSGRMRSRRLAEYRCRGCCQCA